MTPGKDYASCPHCAADNVTYRKICWRCGMLLPYTQGLDGVVRRNTESISRLDIAHVLSKAETLDLEAVRHTAAATPERLSGHDPLLGPNGGLRGASLLWLPRRGESGA